MSTASRREILAGGLCLALGGCLPSAQRPAIVSAATDPNGQHYVVGLAADGAEVFRRPVAFRGHQFLYAPDGQSGVMIGRRPGRYLYRLDFRHPQRDRMIRSQAGRHFYGHAVFSPDGQFLLTAENDYAAARGVIVIRDAWSLQPVHEWDSGGLGPHEMAWLPDSRVLVVANGGLQTHPAQPRKKLNLDSFVSNLAFLDGATGGLLDKVESPVPKASMRHLDVHADGRIVVGLQYEGAATNTVPLVLLYDNGLHTFKSDSGALASMRQYVASVSVASGYDMAVATCPRGHTLTVWDLQARTLLNVLRLRDTGGVAWLDHSDHFLISSGGGALVRATPQVLATAGHLRGLVQRVPETRWDNHITVA
ncbi:MAG: DUF1513 domain-containing protein [Pseudomonadota bacterium]